MTSNQHIGVRLSQVCKSTVHQHLANLINKATDYRFSISCKRAKIELILR
ncbi:hypothetical protein TOT_020000913 [Theileria orientalis strain Shintoku]|uniref:Uncharacterized protein n=1 Tax=Theileria orientalis strain Shintoku TaxID=869250 RepID=J4DPG4_THEOR|nr:hypothetical protein TOT_020000913 [Theileria orientalis strain Shintoku]PVC54483.1 hypothetical protein MACL_00003065 [Theileria orientalis]BAM40659.1 hypothetical protein TOT_020000913 [Theileria orientalis strain Shintoku]|eukprot:XP_009690960.1 hypothetical protein TOT_020000913 [Theileria orientalis strain Shintoku]